MKKAIVGAGATVAALVAVAVVLTLQSPTYERKAR